METLDLSAFFKTKAEALDFSVRLAAISQKVFETDFQLEPALSEQFGLQKKQLLLALLRDNGVQVEKASALKDFLSQLQTQIRSLPVLTLSLAFEPKDKTLKVLSDWFLLNMKRQVLFDITVDPTLIAGIAIHFNGKFLDFSIRETFKKVLSELLTSSPSAPVSTPSQTTAAPTPQAAHL